mmetsp:Transcript_32208/g.84450  ORF Transcript_32208/g.84450 Transcript_32208/m.84450 type:complete len:231 (+) Transcript_32208:2509-3201(+)
MVLDVAGAGEVVVDVGRADALELVEDLLHRLAHHVGEHVETAAVRHAHHDVLDAILRGRVDELLHAHDEDLAALEAEPLGRRVLVRQERLEVVRPAQPVEHAQLVLLGEGHLLRGLNLLADPVHLLVVPDVHVLDADVAGVDVLQPPDHFPQRHRLRRVLHAEEARLHQPVELDGLVHVCLGEAIVGELEIGWSRAVEVGLVETERIELRHVVPAHLVRVDQLRHLVDEF